MDTAIKQIKESGNRNVKFVTGTDTTNYSQSTALFKKLQEDAKQEVHQYKNNNNNNQKEQKKDTSANNFKL